MTTVYEMNESAWKLINRGKVRDVYQSRPTSTCSSSPATASRRSIDVLPTPIPDKGTILTQISNFWFEQDRRTSSPTTSSTRTRVRSGTRSSTGTTTHLDGRTVLVPGDRAAA